MILGGDQYFRFSYKDPEGGSKKSGSATHGRSSQQPKDFEFARQELSRVQNER